MVVGDVIYINTDQAIGFDRRMKYHVYLRDGDWQFDNAFLFINKSDYGGDHCITRSDYSFLTLDYCFFGCGDLIFYNSQEIIPMQQAIVGRLSIASLKEIREKIHNNRMMERKKKRVALESLDGYLPPV